MRRFIITGAPGSGKTAIIRRLELDGFAVIEEAATDVIALAQAEGASEPWTCPEFIDLVVNLQKERLGRASLLADSIQFHDRSVVCTAALATYLEYPYTSLFESELEHVQAESIFERRVFFVRNLGRIHTYRSAANHV
jgi:predicted ATPase